MKSSAATVSTLDPGQRDGAVHVLGIGGSPRWNSTSEQALRCAGRAAEEAGASVELITGGALVLPIYDPDSFIRSDQALALVHALRRADALLISSPSYHGTVSGMIKNALDYVEDLRDDSRPYLEGVPVGCIAVAHGWQASVSALQTLRTCVHALRGWPTPLGATINAATPVFDGETGACVDEAARFQLETVGRQILDFAMFQAGGTWPETAPRARRPGNDAAADGS